MEQDKSFVETVVQRILALSNPDRIILFGSAATGSLTHDSDIDLLVVESSPKNTRGESVRLSQALRGLGHSFDLIVMSTERFNETKGVIGGIAYPANRYGKVIYEVT